MQSYAVIGGKPNKTRVISITRTEDINPTLKIQKIHQPKPKIIQEQVHIIDRRRKRLISEPIQTIKLEETIATVKEEQAKQLEGSKGIKRQQMEKAEELTSHRKAIFKKSDLHRSQELTHHKDNDSNSVRSIILTETSEQISQSSQKYYLTSGYRKLKGHSKPYAHTNRTKNKSDRQKKLSSQPDYPQINIKQIENEEAINSKAFKKKPIFQNAKTERKLNQQELLKPEATTHKKKIFAGEREIKSQQPVVENKLKKKERPQYIKLRPKGCKEKRQTQSVRVSSSSSCSLQVISFQPLSPMIV